MTTDTKAVARYRAVLSHGLIEVEANPAGAFVLFTDHERIVEEIGLLWARELVKRDDALAASRAEVEENEKVINVWRGRTQRAEAEVEGFRSLVNGILENRHKCFIPCDDPKSGTFNWDERAAAAMEDGNV